MELPEAVREQALDDFLEGQPRADQWRSMREALSDRLRDSLATRDQALAKGESTQKLDRKIRELRDQVNALAEEEAISSFVEDSVRQSLQRPVRVPVGDEESEAED